jgi:hypothetical protein
MYCPYEISYLVEFEFVTRVLVLHGSQQFSGQVQPHVASRALEKWRSTKILSDREREREREREIKRIWFVSFIQ